MPVQTTELQIDGCNVKITQFQAVRGFKLQIRLAKLLLPVFGTLFGGEVKGVSKVTAKDIVNSDMDLSKALSVLAESLDEETLLNLMLDLLAATIVDGKGVDRKTFEELFVGNYIFVYKLAVEVIKANRFFEMGDIGNLLQTSDPINPNTK